MTPWLGSKSCSPKTQTFINYTSEKSPLFVSKWISIPKENEPLLLVSHFTMLLVCTRDSSHPSNYISCVLQFIFKSMKLFQCMKIYLHDSFFLEIPYKFFWSLRVWISVQRRELFGLENIYFSDCILRNRHQHRYLMHLDPDELPILGKYSSFTDFIVAAASR